MKSSRRSIREEVLNEDNEVSLVGRLADSFRRPEVDVDGDDCLS